MVWDINDDEPPECKPLQEQAPAIDPIAYIQDEVLIETPTCNDCGGELWGRVTYNVGSSSALGEYYNGPDICLGCLEVRHAAACQARRDAGNPVASVYEILQADEKHTRDQMTDAELQVGRWLSASLDDPKVCAEMKRDVRAWFAEIGRRRLP